MKILQELKNILFAQNADACSRFKGRKGEINSLFNFIELVIPSRYQDEEYDKKLVR